jgi:hypothetical protein
VRRLTRLEASRLTWVALVVLLAAAAAFLLHETRGTTFWVDEWDWAMRRRGNDVGTFLRPHNEHLSLIPIALYRVLFATAGLGDYLPYRIAVTVAHLGVVVLLFVYGRRRVGDFGALLVATVFLLLGPAWQNILWPFQVGSLISLAAGLGVLLCLDRGDRAGDVAACGLLTVSLASSGIGLPIAVGVTLEVLWRRRLGSVWIVGVPIALYAIWWIGYQQTDLVRHNVVVAPGYAADAMAGALSALAGLAGPPTPGGGETLGWGRPLALAAVAGLAWRLPRMVAVPPRVPALMAMAVSFWLATALRRAAISTPYEGRYLYVSALILLLLGLELTRGVRLSPRVLAAAAIVVGAIVVSNFGDMRDGGHLLRDQAPPARAALGALELARSYAEPDTVLTTFPGYPFVVIEAPLYFDAARDIGSPAMDTDEIAAAPEPARQVADANFVMLHGVALAPGSATAPGGSAPAVDDAAGGTVATRGACVGFTPPDARTGEPAPALDVTLPPGGLRLDARGGPATVTLRRFGATFPTTPLATLAARGAGVLRIAGDSAPQPWHVRLAPQGSVSACGL